MKEIRSNRYEGWGNCITHSIRFKIKHGGKIYITWKKGQIYPSFRIKHNNLIYGFVPKNRKSYIPIFNGITVLKKK